MIRTLLALCTQDMSLWKWAGGNFYSWRQEIRHWMGVGSEGWEGLVPWYTGLEVSGRGEHWLCGHGGRSFLPVPTIQGQWGAWWPLLV